MARRPRSFPSLLGWTTVSAMVPGASLIAGGSWLGWIPIFILLILAGGASVLIFFPEARTRAIDLVLQYAVDQQALMIATVALIAVATVWIMLLVLGHAALRNRRFGIGQNIIAFVLLSVLAAAIAAPAYLGVRTLSASRQAISTVFDQTSIDPSAPQATGSDPWASRPRINVLLIGSDAGADRSGIRPDTMIVASINTATGDSTLISLPRNLEGVIFSTPDQTESWQRGCKTNGNGGCMLNAVWLYGEQNADSFGVDPGMAATTQAIEAITGLNIDYNALVNLQGFQDLVDAMGGVDVIAPRDIPIGGGTNVSTGGKYPITGYIEAGPQHLDGYEALWYVRSREGSDNNDRMQRQRCLISKAVDQFDVVRLARTFPQLTASAERNLQTSIGAGELPAFIKLGRQVQAGQINAVTINSDVIDPSDPDYTQIRSLIEDAINPPPVLPVDPVPASPAAPFSPGVPSSPNEAVPTEIIYC